MDSEIIFDIYLMPEFWVFFGWIFISLEDRRIDFAIKLMLIYVKNWYCEESAEFVRLPFHAK